MDEPSWATWRLDLFTWGWVAWIAFFAIWESAAIIRGDGEALTHHLRPLFLSHPLTWWLALGAWLWLGVHMLAPAWERALLDMVRGG